MTTITQIIWSPEDATDAALRALAFIGEVEIGVEVVGE